MKRWHYWLYYSVIPATAAYENVCVCWKVDVVLQMSLLSRYIHHHQVKKNLLNWYSKTRWSTKNRVFNLTPLFLAGDKPRDGECWHGGIESTHICSSLVPSCVKLLCLSLPWAMWRHNASHTLPAVLTVLLSACVSSLWPSHTSTLLHSTLLSHCMRLTEAELPKLHFLTKSLSTVWPYKAANSENRENYALVLKLPLSVFLSHLQFLSLLLLSHFFIYFSLHFVGICVFSKLSVFLKDMTSLFFYWSFAFV